MRLSPLSRSQRRMLSAIALTTLTGVGLAILCDAPVTAFFERDDVRRLARPLFYPFAVGWGTPAIIVVILALLAATNRRALLIGFAVPTLTATAVLHLVKIVVGRARPELGVGAFHFSLFGGLGAKMDSFPSGHAVSAVMLALLVGFYVPRLRTTFWLIGAAAALARVAQDKHYLSDTIAGAGWAALCVYASVRMLGQRYYSLQPPLDPLPIPGARARSNGDAFRRPSKGGE